MDVELDGVEGFDELPDILKYDIAINKIADGARHKKITGASIEMIISNLKKSRHQGRKNSDKVHFGERSEYLRGALS